MSHAQSCSLVSFWQYLHLQVYRKYGFGAVLKVHLLCISLSLLNIYKHTMKMGVYMKEPNGALCLSTFVKY